MKQDANKKLGRGLSALLGESKGQNQLPAVNKNDELVAQIELTKIIAGIYQPRQHFNNTEIEELADSIKEKGVLQPIILRKTDDENYEIIAGERRYRACQIVGLRTIPAIIKKLNNHEALEFALIENIQRENLSPIEEALGYKKLINEFSYTQEEVAKKLGKSRSHIANLLRLLNLPQIVQNMLSMNQISMGHARAIINSQNPEELAQRIISESLNVRDVEELIRDEKFEESQKLIPTVKRENKVKLVNSDYVIDLERKISDLMEMEVKISFNAMKGAGKMTVKFDGIEALHDLIKKLK